MTNAIYFFKLQLLKTNQTPIRMRKFCNIYLYYTNIRGNIDKIQWHLLII